MDDRDLNFRLDELGRKSARSLRPDFTRMFWSRVAGKRPTSTGPISQIARALSWRTAPAAFALIAGSLAGVNAAQAHDRDILDAFDPSGPYALVSFDEGAGR
ncbi:hypothetical protein E5163_10225 [Marinicauda algicola]|uniref:Uncharacterized protein n=1 Tax=Marinicauda algicola TaxID=2029849 RepID=A0A4S2GY97_9PROT|nr:hypothetical protein [Marinicauda algicola]TGY88200.1 hypothetical protein E5163_10225 [Marinicauda algicola]